MKACLPWLGALLASIVCADLAAAQYPGPYSYMGPPPRTAPDMMGRGFYSYNCYGGVYGPNYCVHPPFAPVGAMPPPMPSMKPPCMNFPRHPYARGPRDFFMLDQ